MLSDQELEQLEAKARAATPGPYFWDSYSRIFALVEPGSDWDSDPEERTGNAIVLWVAQRPDHVGHGDELHSDQARANARYAEAFHPQLILSLLEEIRHLRAVNALLRKV